MIRMHRYPALDFELDFEEWLDRQRDRDDSVGDLARDVRVDPCWPAGCRIVRLHEHLAWWGACEGAHRSLEQAWREWEMELDHELTTVYVDDAGGEAEGRSTT